MTGYIMDKTGAIRELPVLLGWEIEHGMGQPCDAFTAECLYEPEMLPVLKQAVRFRAVHEGQVVFYGVVDAYTVTADVRGMRLKLEGRSLAALLMDNEAESGEYYNVGLEDILRRHVTPWGITNLEKAEVPKLARFSVSSGQSQWSVLREFLRLSGGLEPRFTPAGTLLLDGGRGGDTRSIGGATAVSDVKFRDDRYGVVSRGLVKKTRSGAVSTVDNEPFLARGGSARRVVQVPRYTDYDAMRYTGEYQIAQSKADSVVCTLTVASLFAAFAGDTVFLHTSPIGLTGRYRVSRSRCWAEAGRYGTELTLAVWEAW